MGLVENLHSWKKRTICRQRSAVEGLVHDDGSETGSKAKKLNGQKVLLASMRPTRPVKNNQKYGVRARTAHSSIWYALSRNPFSHLPCPSLPLPTSTPFPFPFNNNVPELTFQMKARIRSLKLKKTEEVKDLISSLAVYSRKVEMMSMWGGVIL
jgi:hypothetical protein